MSAAERCSATLNNYHSCGGRFDVDQRLHRLDEIQQLMALEGFWQDTEKASQVQKEKAQHEKVIREIQGLEAGLEELELFWEYAQQGDAAVLAEGLAHCKLLQQQFKAVQRKALLSQEQDGLNAIISINAGAGGTESCDWAQMLFRMIKKWAETRHFAVKIFDHQYGDGAGIKSITFSIEGDDAYGLLKSESGIHRLVRISPFDSNARRHTSFSSIFVSPEVDDKIEIEILDKDLRIDVYRSGGAGGQSVNTTDSAVRITHLPTGLVITCQNERSQQQNKLQAMKILKSRLYERELESRRKKLDEIEASKMDNSWGSQIRSYVLHPYQLVKDHRTNFETSDAQSVLDGDLDDFMQAYLQFQALEQSRSKD
jgi:peptide chain release factor 2